MRRWVALVLLIGFSGWAAAEPPGPPDDVGKPPAWDALPYKEAGGEIAAKSPDPDPGQPYLEALLPADYGELAETPNQRRRRLQVPVTTSLEDLERLDALLDSAEQTVASAALMK